MSQMSDERKGRCLNMAEVIDSYRVFPRTFLTLFFLGYCWLMLESWQWYKGLPFADLEAVKLAALTAFPVTLLTALGGMFTSMYKHYQDSGRVWKSEA